MDVVNHDREDEISKLYEEVVKGAIGDETRVSEYKVNEGGMNKGGVNEGEIVCVESDDDDDSDDVIFNYDGALNITFEVSDKCSNDFM